MPWVEMCGRWRSLASAEATDSAQADLGEDALTGQQFRGQADHEAQHGQASVPGFRESDEAEARGGISHEIVGKCF